MHCGDPHEAGYPGESARRRQGRTTANQTRVPNCGCFCNPNPHQKPFKYCLLTPLNSKIERHPEPSAKDLRILPTAALPRVPHPFALLRKGGGKSPSCHRSQGEPRPAPYKLPTDPRESTHKTQPPLGRLPQPHPPRALPHHLRSHVLAPLPHQPAPPLGKAHPPPPPRPTLPGLHRHRDQPLSAALPKGQRTYRRHPLAQNPLLRLLHRRRSPNPRHLLPHRRNHRRRHQPLGAYPSPQAQPHDALRQLALARVRRPPRLRHPLRARRLPAHRKPPASRAHHPDRLHLRPLRHRARPPRPPPQPRRPPHPRPHQLPLRRDPYRRPLHPRRLPRSPPPPTTTRSTTATTASTPNPKPCSASSAKTPKHEPQQIGSYRFRAALRFFARRASDAL